MIAAPIAPARSPRRDGTIRRSPVARGSERWKIDLAHARQQLLVGLGDVAADDDRARVEEVHAAGEDLAEVAARVADGLDRLRLTRAHERDDLA